MAAILLDVVVAAVAVDAVVAAVAVVAVVTVIVVTVVDELAVVIACDFAVVTDDSADFIAAVMRLLLQRYCYLSRCKHLLSSLLLSLLLLHRSLMLFAIITVVVEIAVLSAYCHCY